MSLPDTIIRADILAAITAFDKGVAHRISGSTGYDFSSRVVATRRRRLWGELGDSVAGDVAERLPALGRQCQPVGCVARPGTR
jgi:hypothetical protein